MQPQLMLTARMIRRMPLCIEKVVVEPIWASVDSVDRLF